MKTVFAIFIGIAAGSLAGAALDGAGLVAQCLASVCVSFVTTYGVLEVLS